MSQEGRGVELGRRSSITAPEDQGVTFIELFFDLVFVFAVTQTSSLLHDDLSLIGVIRFIIVFWMIWWGWTQFTWALNGADTTHHRIQLATLAAVVVAFALAGGTRSAFEPGSGLWFAVPYVLLRTIGLGVYLSVAAADLPQRKAVLSFWAFSSIGQILAIVGALATDPGRTILWGTILAADLLAALRSGRGDAWRLRPDHFVERHGLFVILALGESLIAAGLPVASLERTSGLVIAATLAVLVTCAMWWVYFDHHKPTIEAAINATSNAELTALARDVYSLLHFPVLCGVVAIAVTLSDAVANPSATLSTRTTVALALGLLSFVAALEVIHRRATGDWIWQTVVICAITSVAIILARPLAPFAPLVVAVTGLAGIALFEELRSERRAGARVIPQRQKGA